MPDYLTLTQDNQDDGIVSFVGGQEADLQSHLLNLSIWSKVLETLPKPGAENYSEALVKAYTERIRQVKERITEVSALLEVGKKHLPSSARVKQPMPD